LVFGPSFDSTHVENVVAALDLSVSYRISVDAPPRAAGAFHVSDTFERNRRLVVSPGVAQTRPLPSSQSVAATAHEASISEPYPSPSRSVHPAVRSFASVSELFGSDFQGERGNSGFPLVIRVRHL
jgi:hypothetical protein